MATQRILRNLTVEDMRDLEDEELVVIDEDELMNAISLDDNQLRAWLAMELAMTREALELTRES